MTRKDFLSSMPLIPAAAAASAPAAFHVIENRVFRVAIRAAEGRMHTRVVHRPSELVLADAPYSYSLGVPVSMRLSASRGKFTLEGLALGHLRVLHEIRIPDGEPWIEEEITITNTGSQPVDLGHPRCRFVLPLRLDGREGTGPLKDPAARKAHQDAMTAYRRLKPFFASGVFYGIDEQTHVHRHPAESRAVINCFNLEDRPVTRTWEFDPARFGLDPSRHYALPREVSIPAYGHVLVEVNAPQ